MRIKRENTASGLSGAGQKRSLIRLIVPPWPDTTAFPTVNARTVLNGVFMKQFDLDSVRFDTLRIEQRSD
jgi:hypothetical protein